MKNSNPKSIIARASCRVDLAGGTLDLWPLYLFHPGALTLNFALEILTTCRVTPLKGQRIELCSIDTGCLRLRFSGHSRLHSRSTCR